MPFLPFYLLFQFEHKINLNRKFIFFVLFLVGLNYLNTNSYIVHHANNNVMVLFLIQEIRSADNLSQNLRLVTCGSVFTMIWKLCAGHHFSLSANMIKISVIGLTYLGPLPEMLLRAVVDFDLRS